MRMVRNSEAVLERITDEIAVIGVGEIHNSRSAIKFIMDNIDQLIPGDTNRKTYFLSEFLPKNCQFNPPNKEDPSLRSYLISRAFFSQKKPYDVHMSQRGRLRSTKETVYTLQNMYNALYKRGVKILSIETQVDGSADAKALHKRITDGDLNAYQERVVSVNNRAVDEAKRIFQEDASARIIIFAGMGHTDTCITKKFDTKGKSVGEITTLGICERLSVEGFAALSVATHDIDLCDDRELFQDVNLVADCFTRYANNDEVTTVQQTDFLLLMDVPSDGEKTVNDECESIFYPALMTGVNPLKNRTQQRPEMIRRKIEELTVRNDENVLNPPRPGVNT